MADVPMVWTDCWCGLPFAMPKRLHDECYKTGSTFYCPLGHTIAYKEPENDKLRRERDRLQQQLAYKDDLIEMERKSASAYKGQVTRLRNRAKAGVCPCCTRHFTNLERHMKSQHPDFAADAPDLKVVAGGKSA